MNEHLTISKMVDDLIFFIDSHPKYDGKFIDDLLDVYENHGELTQNQISALLEIYEKWKVADYLKTKKYNLSEDYG